MQDPILFYSDSDNALKWTQLGYSKSQNYIDIKYQFSKALYEKRIIQPIYVETNKNTADLFTKPLQIPVPIRQSRRIGVHLQEDF